jgi:hypothetical protein
VLYVAIQTPPHVLASDTDINNDILITVFAFNFNLSNTWPLVRKLNIPIDRPPLVDEI